MYLFVILISNSWDIETNPGPDSRSDDSLYLCGLCDVSVGWEDRGICCCDTCNVWYHIDCQGMSTTMYGVYNRTLNKSIAWECIRCGMPNFSTSLFDTSASLDVSNRFETLSTLSEPDSPIPDNIAPPPKKKAASSPIVLKEAKPKTKKAVLNHPLRILIMNCQSINNKRADTVIDSAKADIILGNESWLTPDIKNSEIFPDSFDAIRKDRLGDSHGGGVFIAFRRDLLCTESPEQDANCEIIWCKLNIIGCRTLYLGSFYRPPRCIDPEYLTELNKSLTRIMTNKNAHVLLGGDFNCGDVEWSTCRYPKGYHKGRYNVNF